MRPELRALAGKPIAGFDRRQIDRLLSLTR